MTGHDHDAEVAAYGDCISCAREQLTAPPAHRPSADAGSTVAGSTSTSRLAAARALPRSGSDRRRVLDAIVAAGERGMTDDELEVELRLPHQTASARRHGLVADGWVRASGRERRTRTDHLAIVWVGVSQ